MSTRDRRELAAIFIGGAVGTVSRAAVAVCLGPLSAAVWPWPTFTVNIVGALLLGYFTTRLLERLPVSSYRRPALGTGLCGGLTTFSTMQVETLKMLEAHHYGLAMQYTGLSVVGGLAAISLGNSLARRMRATR
jgi:fluoride exporter